jgi:hypothetical protein
MVPPIFEILVLKDVIRPEYIVLRLCGNPPRDTIDIRSILWKCLFFFDVIECKDKIDSIIMENHADPEGINNIHHHSPDVAVRMR